jgi:hypothetical protein
VDILTGAGMKPEDIVSLVDQPGGDASGWAVLTQQENTE